MVAASVPICPQAIALVHFRTGPKKLVLPDTSVDLAWVDGRVDVIGPMTVGRPGRYAIGTPVVLLTLSAEAATHWLNTPLSGLVDRVTGLRDIDARHAAAMTERFATGTVRDLVAPAHDPTRSLVSRAATATALLLRGEPVAKVAVAVNLGERQFTRWFQQRYGMAPKQFQKVARLRRAMVAAKRGAPLAAIAAECGYADQAHFNRNVRELTGGTPRDILPHVGNVQDIGEPLS